MALDPLTFSDAFTPQVLDAWAIDSDGNPNKFKEDPYNPELEVPDITLPVAAGGTFDFGQAFADAYKTYADEGIVFGIDPDNTVLGDDSGIVSALNGGALTPVALAQGFVTFWSTSHLTVQDLANGGVSPLGVTNDASTKLSQFQAAIVNSGILYNGVKSEPYYEGFIAEIEVVVKTIVWTVNELIGIVPTAFPTNIT